MAGAGGGLKARRRDDHRVGAGRHRLEAVAPLRVGLHGSQLVGSCGQRDLGADHDRVLRIG